MKLISFTCRECGRSFSAFAFNRDALGVEARAKGWALEARQLRAGVVYEWHCPEHRQVSLPLASAT